MSNATEVFRILEKTDLSGAAPRSVTDGVDVAAALLGLIAFGYKDSAGRVVLPQLTDEGFIPMSEGAIVTVEAYATTPIVTVATRTLITTATLIASKIYEISYYSGAATQTMFWEIEQTNDVALNVRHAFITGPGQYTKDGWSTKMRVTAGATGVQAMKIYATQISGKVTDASAHIVLKRIGA